MHNCICVQRRYTITECVILDEKVVLLSKAYCIQFLPSNAVSYIIVDKLVASWFYFRPTIGVLLNIKNKIDPFRKIANR